MSIYINTETLEYPLFEGDIRLKCPNTSFAANNFEAPAPYAKVTTIDYPVVDYTKNVAEGVPTNAHGAWTQVFNVTEASADEKASRTDNKAQEVRGIRNGLLSSSDWTQLADASVDNLAWAVYRQALRDLPSQAGFPFDVIYPTKP